MVKWTKILSCATGILALAAICSDVIIWKQLQLTEGQLREAVRNTDVLISAQRAWLAPIALKAPPSWELPANQLAEATLVYANIGKEPATKTTLDIVATAIPKSYYRDSTAMERTINEIMGGRKCRATTSIANGLTVYPGIPGAHEIAVGFNAQERTKINSGTYFPLVVACFAYETGGKTHHSEFCSILERLNDGKWRSDSCFGHNTGD